ncbi:hypothetical protein KUTeg_005994 [Tegillarca granosa]|uniref:Solute carrier family 40 member n=1 Tax=Tegillarca granosa TaxID=220873 RepID=A0ABQ9FFA3_TEGGR|nr:hypothetical protein KUTeg_005994 [Tegillarca granosa]
MWWFGIGLFLIEVAPESLQLTAVYGFTSGGAMLLLAAVVGDWIDRSQRLKAARVALISNNISVLVCCVLVFVVLTYKQQIEEQMENKLLLYICFALIVIVTIVTNLCNLGRTLIMERDWIVEICGRHKDTIATMSATFRAIDLTTKIIAPLITGQVMTYASPRIGALCIGSWNIISVFIEYFLVWKVYSIFPALQKEKQHVDVDKDHEIDVVLMNKKGDNENRISEENRGQADAVDTDVTLQKSGKEKSHGLLYKIFSSLISLVRGRKYYMKYDVSLAGIAYAFTQGMNESVLGILFGISACFGLIASITYPFIRKQFGLVKTGLLGLSCQISCLTLCMISLGLPGSTFDPKFWDKEKTEPVKLLCNESYAGNFSTQSQDTNNNTLATLNGTINLVQTLSNNCNSTVEFTEEKSKISLIVLFTGILGARFGVWTADLVIAQLFLENIQETERGIVNGFQWSLNKLMDMLKFIMVILIPDPELFGYPAMVSFCFICTAWILYARYTKKTLGYICCK